MFTEIIFGVVVILVAAIIAVALEFGMNLLLAKGDKKNKRLYLMRSNSQLKVTLFLLGLFILARCMI